MASSNHRYGFKKLLVQVPFQSPWEHLVQITCLSKALESTYSPSCGDTDLAQAVHGQAAQDDGEHGAPRGVQGDGLDQPARPPLHNLPLLRHLLHHWGKSGVLPSVKQLTLTYYSDTTRTQLTLTYYTSYTNTTVLHSLHSPITHLTLILQSYTAYTDMTVLHSLHSPITHLTLTHLTLILQSLTQLTLHTDLTYLLHQNPTHLVCTGGHPQSGISEPLPSSFPFSLPRSFLSFLSFLGRPSSPPETAGPRAWPAGRRGELEEKAPGVRELGANSSPSDRDWYCSRVFSRNLPETHRSTRLSIYSLRT